MNVEWDFPGAPWCAVVPSSSDSLLNVCCGVWKLLLQFLLQQILLDTTYLNNNKPCLGSFKFLRGLRSQVLGWAAPGQSLHSRLSLITGQLVGASRSQPPGRRTQGRFSDQGDTAWRALWCKWPLQTTRPVSFPLLWALYFCLYSGFDSSSLGRGLFFGDTCRLSPCKNSENRRTGVQWSGAPSASCFASVVFQNESKLGIELAVSSEILLCVYERKCGHGRFSWRFSV